MMNLLCKVIIANHIGKLHSRKKKGGGINITKRIKKYWLLTWGYCRYFRRLYIFVPPKPPEAVALILKV